MGMSMVMTPHSHALDLMRDGRPVAVIILPSETESDLVFKTQPAAVRAKAKVLGDDEQLAAEELQSIIEKISGAKLTIQRGGALPSGPSIVLGATLARQSGLGGEIDKLAKDGLLCSVKGNALFLSGRRALEAGGHRSAASRRRQRRLAR
ncbi:MAG: hypothetical protein HY360_25055 [Verrucomicrobia bacterium]|nr:hypothetical protein [Verrucomicrobiota bacterium]